MMVISKVSSLHFLWCPPPPTHTKSALPVTFVTPSCKCKTHTMLECRARMLQIIYSHCHWSKYYSRLKVRQKFYRLRHVPRSSLLPPMCSHRSPLVKWFKLSIYAAILWHGYTLSVIKFSLKLNPILHAIWMVDSKHLKHPFTSTFVIRLLSPSTL